MRRIVSDTGPVLHLAEAQALELLPLTGEVHIPKGVAAELAYIIPQWQMPDWLRVDALEDLSQATAYAWEQAELLDAGEAEAIALARQLQADWLLTDDAAARLMAQMLGLEAHGALGVVLWAAAVGHLEQPDAEAVLERLAHSSLWISTRVLAEAKEALNKLFKV